MAVDKEQKKMIISIIQWILSAIGIPALIWAWNLSINVSLLENNTESLEKDVVALESKLDVAQKDISERDVAMARMETKVDGIKERVDEIRKAVVSN